MVAGGDEDFGLAFKSDALWVGTSTDGVDGPAGRLAATAAAVSRVRTTPRVGFSTSDYGRDDRVGYSMGLLEGGSVNFEPGGGAQRRESPMLDGADTGCSAGPPLGW